MRAITRDPVCGMHVRRDSFPLEHLGIHYAFCSRQCLERFKANPHLYIGVPGKPAPRQEGVQVIKRRRFRLEQLPTDAEASLLREALGSMMGIRRVEVSGDTVSLSYDLLQATAEQIESHIVDIGMRLGEGWGERLRRGFIHYFEECEIGNLEITPPSHQGHHN